MWPLGELSYRVVHCVWETVSTDFHIALGVGEAIRGIPGRIPEIDTYCLPGRYPKHHNSRSSGSKAVDLIKVFQQGDFHCRYDF